MKTSAIEDLIAGRMEDVEQAYRAGRRNLTREDPITGLVYNDRPFCVWLIDTEAREGYELAKAIAQASWNNRATGAEQIDGWRDKCSKAGAAAVMAAALPVERSVLIADRFDKATANKLTKEPSPSEFWCVVLTRGWFGCVAVDRPLIVV